MIFLLALIPATALTAAGYVVLYLSHRSEGTLRTFGRYLGIWAFVLAVLVALGGVFAAGHMHRMRAERARMHGPMAPPWMEGWRDGERMERREHEAPGAAPEGQPVPPPGAPGNPPVPASAPAPQR